MTVVNFAAAKDSGFEPLPAGQYLAKLVGHKVEMSSKSSGQPYVQLEFSLPDNNNRKAWSIHSLQPQALWSLRQALVNIGASLELLNSEEADLDETIESVYEAECTLTLSQEEYEGKTRNKVTAIDEAKALSGSGKKK